MTHILIIALSGFCFLWVFTRYYLAGKSMKRFDTPSKAITDHSPREASPAHLDVVKFLKQMHSSRENKKNYFQILKVNRDGSVNPLLTQLREQYDRVFSENVDLSDITIQREMIAGIPGEWVLAENADPEKRMLYIHGGGFFAGSSQMYRSITTKFARTRGISVLSIDYRLMPEHTRIDCLTDCQTAYQWILDNGPNGPSAVKTLYVAGDSAGGNLCLATAQWARDAGLRPADGLIALSPATDTTMGSPSLKRNLETDEFIGPSFGQMLGVPRPVYLWASWLGGKIRPCDPRISPLHGDLANLPPTLVHASAHEMLLDDSRRYVNKAVYMGSEASLEIWPHMVHVWHLFTDTLPEAREAFEHIEEFLHRAERRA